MHIIPSGIVALIAVSLASCVTPCQPKITQAQAIRIAKQQFDKDWGKRAAAYYPRWTAQLQDCTWLVIGHTPPDDISGDARVGVDAETGQAVVGSIVRTDSEKLRHMRILPAASNQPLQP